MNRPIGTTSWRTAASTRTTNENGNNAWNAGWTLGSAVNTGNGDALGYAGTSNVSAMRHFASAPPARSRARSISWYRTSITGIDASSTMGTELATIPADPNGIIHSAAAARNNPIRPGRAWKPSSSKSGRPKKTAKNRTAPEPASDHAGHGADSTQSSMARTTR